MSCIIRQFVSTAVDKVYTDKEYTKTVKDAIRKFLNGEIAKIGTSVGVDVPTLVKTEEGMQVAAAKVPFYDLPKDYYKQLNRLVKQVVGPKVTTNQYLAFSKATLARLVVVGGQYDKGEITLSKKPNQTALEMDAKGMFEQWYVEESPYAVQFQAMNEEQVVKALATDPMYARLSKEYTPQIMAEMMAEWGKVNGMHTLAHEMVHAGSREFMTANPEHANTKRVKELYREALANKADILSMMGKGANEYWTRSVDEFVAEGLSNPDLVYALKNSRTKERSRLSNVFKDLVETLLKMVGIDNTSNVYTYLMDGYIAMVESTAKPKAANTLLDKLNSKAELQESNSLLVPTKVSSDVRIPKGFTAKDETHLTVLGFPQGKELTALFAKSPELKAKLEKLIEKADFSYTLKDDAYRIERDREAWVDWQDQSKGKETIHEEAVIQLVDAPGVEKFIGEANKLLGTNFPVPFPHISLATKGSKLGIGIANKAAFDALTKEQLDSTNTAEMMTPNHKMKTGFNEIKNVFSAKTNGQALDAIVEYVKDKEEYKEEMQFFSAVKTSGVIDNTPFIVEWASKGFKHIDTKRGVLGSYNRATNRIAMRGDLQTDTFVSAYMHEVVHALTLDGYYTNNEFRSKIDSLYKAALRIKDYRGIPGTMGDYYGLTDAQEFMAEVLSNPDFMYELDKYYAPFHEEANKNSILSEFLEAIKTYIVERLTRMDKSIKPDRLGTTTINVINNYIDVLNAVDNSPVTTRPSSKSRSKPAAKSKLSSAIIDEINKCVG